MANTLKKPKLLCLSCKELRYLKNFQKDDTVLGGLAHDCNRCKRELHTCQCRKCEEYKPVDQYYKSSRTYCKECHKVNNTKYKKDNPESQKRSVKKYQLKNRLSILTKVKERVSTCHDTYISGLIRLRKGSNIKVYKNNLEEHRDLIEKVKTKVKLEREIRTEIIR